MITLLAGWAIVRGSDVVSGELSRGTMEMLLAQPVCRRDVYLRHAKYTVLGLLVLSLMLWLGMSVGVWTASVKESTYPAIYFPTVDFEEQTVDFENCIEFPLQFFEPRVEVNRLANYVNPLMFCVGGFLFYQCQYEGDRKGFGAFCLCGELLYFWVLSSSGID